MERAVLQYATVVLHIMPSLCICDDCDDWLVRVCGRVVAPRVVSRCHVYLGRSKCFNSLCGAYGCPDAAELLCPISCRAT